jgi:hypothetical protein
MVGEGCLGLIEAERGRGCGMATETEMTAAREPGPGQAPVLVTRLGGQQRIFPVGAQVRVGRDPAFELVSVNPRPAMLLITDGLATDPPGGFEAGLSALMTEPAGRAALRLAIAIGRDARSAALDRFIGDPCVPVLVADSSEDIAERLVAASLAVSRMSEAGADRGAVARRLLGAPGDVPSKIFDQDTIV